MATKEELQSRQSQIRAELDQNWETRRNLQNELLGLDIQIGHLDYPCACVVLNKDINVVTNSDLIKGRRNNVNYATVISDTLSANLDCPRCHGTGKSEDA